MSNTLAIQRRFDVDYSSVGEYSKQEEFSFQRNSSKLWQGSITLNTLVAPWICSFQYLEFGPDYGLIPKPEDAYPKPRISFEDIFTASGIPKLGEIRASDIAALFQARTAIIGLGSIPQQDAIIAELTENKAPPMRAVNINGRWVGNPSINFDPEAVVESIRQDRER
jgi:hypothetical protein